MIIEGGYYYDIAIRTERDVIPKGYVLFVLSAGRSRPLSKPYIRTRHTPRNDYQLIYMQKGSLHYKDKAGNNHIAPEGSFVLFKPKEHQEYTIFANDNADMYWCHFAGALAEVLLKEHNLSNRKVITLPENDHYIQLFTFMRKALELKSKNYIELSCLYLQELIITISSEIDMFERGLQQPDPLIAALRYMEENYYSEITLAQLSRAAAASPKTLERMFIHHMGETPMRYLTKFRIIKAKNLLLQTSHKISEISLAVGFQDPLYFSSVFHSLEGVPPSKYRKKHHQDFNNL